MGRVAVFLDRDGTLNEEVGYIRDVERLELIPGAAQAIKKLNDAGLLAILATNQSGVARGFYDESHIHALHDRLATLLDTQAGAKLDAVFYSPYLPHGSVEAYAKDSDCRKPGPGMIQQACAQFGDIDLTRSFVVGDKATDIEFAFNAGCRGILLKTGYGQRVLEGKYQTLDHKPWRVCADISEAVDAILAEVQ